MRRPEAVLFDLDDTLINRHKMFHAFSEYFVRDHFPEASGERRSEILDTLRRMDENGNARRPELFYRLYGEIHAKMPPEKELLHYWNTVFPQCMVVMDGMHALLTGLNAMNIKIALVTNGDPELQNNKIDKAGIRNYFQTVIISGETDYEKPDVRIFELALRSLGVRAEQAVFVGDNPINDISGAQRAGIRDIWINCFQETDLKGVRPSAEIRSLNELIEMAEKWRTA